MPSSKSIKKSKRQASLAPHGAGAAAAAPAAVMRSGATRLGLSDIRNLKLGYYLCDVLNGDGTNGASGDVYATVTVSGTRYRPKIIGFVLNNGAGYVPIAPGDVTWGAPYAQSLMSNFNRKVFKRVLLHYEPYGSGTSTTTGASIAIAPLRGGGYTFQREAHNSNTTAQTPLVAVLGMKGAEEFPAWQRKTIDLTPYMAGPGGGARRDTGGVEFPIAAENVYQNSDPNDNANIVPCAFVVAGHAGSTAAILGNIRIELVMDLLDFNAQLVVAGTQAPSGIKSIEPIESKKASTGAQMAGPSRDEVKSSGPVDSFRSAASSAPSSHPIVSGVVASAALDLSKSSMQTLGALAEKFVVVRESDLPSKSGKQGRE